MGRKTSKFINLCLLLVASQLGRESLNLLVEKDARQQQMAPNYLNRAFGLINLFTFIKF